MMPCHFEHYQYNIRSQVNNIKKKIFLRHLHEDLNAYIKCQGFRGKTQDSRLSTNYISFLFPKILSNIDNIFGNRNEGV